MNTEYSRIVTKRSTQSGVTPTIPLTGATFNDYLDTDLLNGEMFVNTADGRAWFRGDDDIYEIYTTSGATASDTYVTGGTLTSTDLVLTLNDGTSATTSFTTVVRTSGDQTINGIKTFEATNVNIEDNGNPFLRINDTGVLGGIDGNVDITSSNGQATLTSDKGLNVEYAGGSSTWAGIKVYDEDTTNNESVQTGVAVTTVNRPTNNLFTGRMVFDTTLGYPIWYDGANWVNFSGGTV